ncbi:hypothetical protein OSK38_26295, partial [Escherichia coli]|nr:hypothetical protein [Escherichia coli]
MTNKILKISGLGLASLGLVFLTGEISADAHNAGAKLQTSAQVKEESKVEKHLEKLEGKVNELNLK